jgi:TatD DNase family protein
LSEGAIARNCSESVLNGYMRPLRRPAWLLLDAHVHLPAYPDAGRLLRQARESGITLVSVTTSLGEVEAGERLGRENRPLVRSFVGVHPSEALVSPRIDGSAPFWGRADGVGEIGLDPKYSEVSPGGAQMSVFLAQLEVAERLGKPVQVHSRDAEQACLEAVGSHRLPRVLFHWFQAEGLLGRVVSAGYYVSYGPAILYSKRAMRMAMDTARDRVLTESDGPVSFGPLGGVEGPGLIPSVVFKLAELWGEDFGSTALQIESNGRAFLETKG